MLKLISLRLILFLYGLLMLFILPLMILKVFLRGVKESQYRYNVLQRLGITSSGLPNEDQRVLWVHAVSLGETRAIAPLVRAWRERCPNDVLLLTHSTATGWLAGRDLLCPGDKQQWLPFDVPWILRRFFRHWRPSEVWLVETEVWPFLILESKKFATRTVLVNGRMSMKTMEKWSRLSILAKRVFGGLDFVLAQSKDDAQRLMALGAKHVTVTGNLKYDLVVPNELLEQGAYWRSLLRDPVIVFASSRDGEERLWLDAWSKVRHSWPRVIWLIVPRHPNRWGEVEALLRYGGFSSLARTAWSDNSLSAVSGSNATVLLGDSLGEMPSYFEMADFALMGGSFAPYGGQNVIEALACGCPVIAGPHMFNFSQAVADLRGEALTVVDNIDEALRRAKDWLEDPAALRSRRRVGVALVGRFSGGVERTIQALFPHS